MTGAPRTSARARGIWVRKFDRLLDIRQKADDDILVAIYEGRKAGLTLADLAFMARGASQSTITAKAVLGEKIAQERAKTA